MTIVDDETMRAAMPLLEACRKDAYAARAAAWAAAREHLDDTVTELQGKAVDLLDRMCEVGR